MFASVKEMVLEAVHIQCVKQGSGAVAEANANVSSMPTVSAMLQKVRKLYQQLTVHGKWTYGQAQNMLSKTWENHVRPSKNSIEHK